MKFHYLPIFILCQLVSISLFGNGEPVCYDTEAPLIEHLISINKEWTKQKDIPTHLMTIPIKFNSDEERIQLHLQLVEATLKARSSDDLTIQQFANRKKNLQSLMSYWREGQFPINTRHSHRQPYFIDDFGTACAVGHLLLTSGEEDLANHISDIQNYAYIHEMNYPKLVEWASENGFTKDELAWIQPGYGEYCHYAEEIDDVPDYSEDYEPLSQQEIRVMLTLPDESMMIVGGSFLHYESATGTQTASVFGYDGNNYISFGNAIQGTVYDIEYHNNQIYVSGDFVLAGTDSHNVAYWDGTNWVGIQTSNMNGTVKDIASYECQLYAGGDFTTVDGNGIAYLAVWNGTAWSAVPQDCSGQSAPSALQVNAPVNALEAYNEKLAIGGEFTAVVGNATSVEGLIFLDNLTTELLPEHGSMTSVDNLEVYLSALMVGGDSLYAYRWDKWYYPLDTLLMDEFYGYYFYDPQIPAVGRTHTLYHPSHIDIFAAWYQEVTHLVISTNQEVFAINGVPDGIYGPANPDYHFSTNGTVYAITHFEGISYHGGNFNTVTVETNSNMREDCDEDYDVLNIFSMHKFIYTPIELAEFTVTNNNNKTAQLAWTSLTESNSLHYEVERKIDNEDFMRIGVVSAAGESIDKIDYTFEDDISTIKGEYVYYRLKMVDKNGSSEDSDTRSLKLKTTGTQVDIYPNPAEHTVEISMQIQKGDLTVNIYDLQGQQVNTYQWTYDSSSMVREQIDISHLASGLYLVEVISPKERITKRLEIVK